MPTYEYECRNCNHEFELFQQMTAPVKRKCPKCGKMTLRRLVGTGAGILFKGNGFYETDYRSESYKKAAQAEKTAANGSSKKSSDKKKDTAPTNGQASSNGKKKSETKKAVTT